MMEGETKEIRIERKGEKEKYEEENV